MSILFAKPPDSAWDPNGPRAPGYPGDPETGQPDYARPEGEPSWVPNPNGNGYGWEDADGHVWVPTGWGEDAHGGPHWDVQNPRTGRYAVKRPRKSSAWNVDMEKLLLIEEPTFGCQLDEKDSLNGCRLSVA
jgi:hypothetical protein